jgi:hypothetical protein
VVTVEEPQVKKQHRAAVTTELQILAEAEDQFVTIQLAAKVVQEW